MEGQVPIIVAGLLALARAKSWQEYFDTYGRESQRARQQHCEQARLILDWFATGAPLTPRDLK